MKKLFRKELIICALLLAACDSNEPTDEDASIFFGSYQARDAVGVVLNIGSNAPDTYWAGMGFGSAGFNLDCTGDSRTLTCKEEEPISFSSDPYTLTKTSYGLDMVGHFTYEFEEVNPQGINNREDYLDQK